MPLAPRKASNLAPYLWLISPSTDTSQVALPPNPQPPSRLPVIPAEAGIQTPVPTPTAPTQATPLFPYRNSQDSSMATFQTILKIPKSQNPENPDSDKKARDIPNGCPSPHAKPAALRINGG